MTPRGGPDLEALREIVADRLGLLVDEGRTGILDEAVERRLRANHVRDWPSYRRILDDPARPAAEMGALAEALRGVTQDFHLRHTHEAFYYQLRPRPEAAPPGPAVPAGEDFVEAVRRASERIAVLADAASRLAAPRRAAIDRTLAVALIAQERFADALALLDGTGAPAGPPRRHRRRRTPPRPQGLGTRRSRGAEADRARAGRRRGLPRPRRDPRGDRPGLRPGRPPRLRHDPALGGLARDRRGRGDRARRARLRRARSRPPPARSRRPRAAPT